MVLAGLVLTAGCSGRASEPRAWERDSIPEAYAHSIAVLTWPGATRAFQVTEAGNLFNGAYLVRIQTQAGSDTARAARVVAAEDRWLPVLRWTRWSGAVRWEFEAVAVPEAAPGMFSARGSIARRMARDDRDRDDAQIRRVMAGYPESRMDSLLLRVRRPLEREAIDRSSFFVSLQIRAGNTGSSGQRTSLRMRCEPPPRPAPFANPDSSVRTPWNSCWSAATVGDSVIGAGAGHAEGAELSDVFELAPGEQRAIHVILGAYPAPVSAVRRWASKPHEAYVEHTRAYWLRETARGTRFGLPDSELVNAMRAAEVVLLQSRERRTTDWVPIGNPFQYRDVWLRDGAREMQALAITGFTKESRQLTESFLEFQWPHGPFVSQTGQLDGSGQAMWAFEQVCLRPAADEHVERYARSALLAWRAIERQRKRAGGGAASPFATMLPVTDRTMPN